ncbi:hypothetical protein [Chroococcidiopsis sp. TS-821]|uniref:hypothetical protein n=1 Tax=Chroococcidiopsis sp. TS-821 TaxID=1378066 RepID=UPI001AEF8DC2|nr:hypothetical protein [Chroococcidiopsis sp. TS-821]
MTASSTVRQILSSEQGLLPYIHRRLATDEFAHFRSQFGFHAEESSTEVNGDRAAQLQITLSITLKFSIIVDPQLSADDAMILAIEFQEMIDNCLVAWSQQNTQLLSPITQIKGAFGRLEEVRYHGGFLPGFLIERQFRLSYKSSTATTDKSSSIANELYKPGEIVPESGLYELTGPRGGHKGQEVTATKGEPFPPTPEPGMHYRLVTPTKHKNS